MMIKRVLYLPLIAVLLSACSDGGGNSSGVAARPALALEFSEAPVALPDTSARFAKDVRYGEAERNVFDILLPDCDEPTPLVMYIHGGGFTGGDKSGGYERFQDVIMESLQACVAFAAVNYSLLEIPGPDGDINAAAAQGGVLTSLQDTARALQFMRYHFESLNLDVDNVASFGGSAGAGASLWLGTHDDMADPDNADPVLRESTRIKAVGAIATQATYDLADWEQILLPLTADFAEILGGTDIPTVASAVGAENYLLTFLGITSIDAIDTPEQEAWRANVDMLELMDAGDAPIYVHNFDTGFGDLLNMLLHHGLHALAVKQRADEVGLHSVAYIEDPVYGLEDPSGEELASFLLRHIR